MFLIYIDSVDYYCNIIVLNMVIPALETGGQEAGRCN